MIVHKCVSRQAHIRLFERKTELRSVRTARRRRDVSRGYGAEYRGGSGVKTPGFDTGGTRG